MTHSNETGWSPEQMNQLRELAATTDPGFVAELLEDFERDGAVYFREIMDAIGSGEVERLRLAAHSLKSMGRSLGFEALGRACERIEAGTDGTRPSVGSFEEEVSVIQADLARSSLLREHWISNHAG